MLKVKKCWISVKDMWKYQKMDPSAFKGLVFGHYLEDANPRLHIQVRVTMLSPSPLSESTVPSVRSSPCFACSRRTKEKH
jgi:hypothetical protein